MKRTLEGRRTVRTLAILTGLALTATLLAHTEPEESTVASSKEHPTWSAFEMEALMADRRKSGRAYLEFLRVPDMNAGIYHLQAGAVDRQRPHGEDEIYYVVRGRGRFEVGGKDMEVQAGSVLYVRAGAAHRFHSITEDLTLLVVFAA